MMEIQVGALIFAGMGLLFLLIGIFLMKVFGRSRKTASMVTTAWWMWNAEETVVVAAHIIIPYLNTMPEAECSGWYRLLEAAHAGIRREKKRNYIMIRKNRKNSGANAIQK